MIKDQKCEIYAYGIPRKTIINELLLLNYKRKLNTQGYN